MFNNIENNTISEKDAKKDLNAWNKIKNVEIIKYKKRTRGHKKLLNLFNIFLDIILTDKIWESESQKNKNENENEKVESRTEENEDKDYENKMNMKMKMKIMKMKLNMKMKMKIMKIKMDMNMNMKIMKIKMNMNMKMKINMKIIMKQWVKTKKRK